MNKINLKNILKPDFIKKSMIADMNFNTQSNIVIKYHSKLNKINYYYCIFIILETEKISGLRQCLRIELKFWWDCIFFK